jgi:predicted porin
MHRESAAKAWIPRIGAEPHYDIRRHMNKTALYAAILAIYSVATPACADELADLKAEIAAQKIQAAQQKIRLDALEAKLDQVQAQSGQPVQVAAPAPGMQQPAGKPSSVSAAANDQPAASVGGKPAGISYSRGDGLTFATAGGSATLYGLLDVTYVHTNHANANGDSVTSPRVAWFSGNRWGLTGRHTMGDSGLNVIFRLESEFESQTGAMDTANVLFNRDAWVGVESPEFGKFTLGRQNAIGRDPTASAIYGDPYGPAKPSTEEGGYTNNNNFKQLIFYAGSATGTRIDNGVVWKKAFDFGLVAGAEYQFGGIPGDFSNGSTKTGTLAYSAGIFNVAGFATSAKVAGLTDHSYSIGGNVLLMDLLRVNAGYFRYSADQGALGGRRDNAYTVSAKFAPKGNIDYELGYQEMKANNAAVNGGGNVLNAFANASAAKATATGSRSTVYGSVFYHFDKITEVYIAADDLKLKDGYKVGATNGKPSQTEFGIGLRTRF